VDELFRGFHICVDIFLILKIGKCCCRVPRKKMTRMEDAKDVLKRLGLYFHDSDSLDGFLERTSIRKLKKRT
jgi:hypothetical protein